MKLLIILFLFVACSGYSQTKPFPKIAFGKGVCVVYVGSGAVTRHIDWNRFKPETGSYRRTPFLAIGFDRCILPYASNAYWGLGPYLSSWMATRAYTDINDNRKENVWSSTLIAMRASHHNAYFVRKKLDMCSGILLGARIKYYHVKTLNEKNVTPTSDRTTFYPAFGLTFTLRYYFCKNIGFYLDGCLGYKTDLMSVGLVYKIH